MDGTLGPRAASPVAEGEGLQPCSPSTAFPLSQGCHEENEIHLVKSPVWHYDGRLEACAVTMKPHSSIHHVFGAL